MASSTMEFVLRDGTENVKEVIGGIHNRFQLSWMEEKVTLKDILSEHFWKLKEPGMVWCPTCNMKLW